MVSEKIILRTEPLFQFDFLTEGFKVTDDSKDNTSRFYEYKNIINPEYRSKSINWISTLLNCFGFLNVVLGSPGLHYDTYQIRFEYGKQEVIILTENCEFKKVVEISEKIKSTISNLNTQY